MRDAESIRQAFGAGRWGAELSADPSDRFHAVIVSQQWLGAGDPALRDGWIAPPDVIEVDGLDTENALTLVEQLLISMSKGSESRDKDHGFHADPTAR